MSLYSNTHDTVQNTIYELYKQKEALILDQLGYMFKEGIITLEETQTVFVKDPDPLSNKVRLQQEVRLKFNGEEKYLALKKENEELRKIIEDIRKAVGN